MLELVPLPTQSLAASPVGVLLANVGTPDAPTPRDLRRYLAEFLADPRVVELPRWLWLPILHGLVLNTRSALSARLYQRVWTVAGSPQLTVTNRQAAGLRTLLQARTGCDLPVAVGMRYGQPSIASALRRL